MTDVSPSNPTMDSAVERRKRVSGSEEELSIPKRPRMSFYIRLESESSRASDDDDTESVYSIQDKETDVARDSDSDSDSEMGSTSELESGAELATLEYDVASLSRGDDFPGYTSSGTEDMNMQVAAEGAIAAVLLDTSLEPCETAGNTSDGSAIFDASDLVECRRDFRTCLQCNVHNDKPAFRYCDKCFQMMSDYLMKLSTEMKDVADGYRARISLINNVDPFSLTEDDIDCSINAFPAISMEDIAAYLVVTHSFYTAQQMLAFKSLMRLVLSNYVE